MERPSIFLKSHSRCKYFRLSNKSDESAPDTKEKPTAQQALASQIVKAELARENKNKSPASKQLPIKIVVFRPIKSAKAPEGISSNIKIHKITDSMK